ncbi:hypothetical protein GALMADRAFT_140226 [Galerina marginata CBS 339.88]|uniref:Uncharacterized protein n=1 Tax=Galerina marginata (strain CBS 339.88) TaxID=685588 RepID=A0A067SXH9_GALM3|nr:hypothetical protein GALMADRAFT_140226 [Galerina marginata CBS 339.88]
MQNSMNGIQQYVGNFTLSAKNADPANWEWKAEYKARWNLAESHWQTFCETWYGVPESQPVDSKSPSLSLEPLPRRIDDSISSTILVRNSYVEMFDTIWARSIKTRGRHGVIVTGQSGTGKTLFNYYLLIRLLRLKQVVLFSPEGNQVYLFYHGEVYTNSMEALTAVSVDVPFPDPISSSNAFIWSLFDIQEPDIFLVSHPCFPVQTTSPDPRRYSLWRKKQRPLLTGLPLWTRDELLQGLQYQVEYPELLDALHNLVYGRSSLNLRDPLKPYYGARAILEERYGGKDIAPPSLEDAVDCLLDAVIDRFGYSARGVFGAVFD